MDEQKAASPVSQSAPTPAQPENPALEQPEVKEERLLFNVMPKVASSTVVQPSISVMETEAAPQEKKPGINMKYVKYGIGTALILAAGIAAYIYVPKFFVEDYGGQDLLVKQPVNKAPVSPAVDPNEKKSQWLLNYFGTTTCENQATCGDEVDTDRDGLTNVQEFEKSTDPNNKDSDGDGLADGDEVNVFGSDPLKEYTSEKREYKDLDFVKGGYDIATDGKLTETQLKEIGNRMQTFGLHQPTFTSLGEVLNSLYKFSGQGEENITQTASSTAEILKNFEQTMEAKTERDLQRSSTIQNIGIALLRYKDDYQAFPKTTSFSEMFGKVRPYLKIATNPTDPINQGEYVYSYQANAQATDFTLSFYSEVAGQVIKRTSQNAQEDKTKAEAAIFDNQRKDDLESIRQSLLLYSANNVGGEVEYVFPSKEKYKTAIVPEYLSSVPKDPKTQSDYEYQVSEDFASFTLKAVFDNPKPGTTGFLCNQEECREY
jgi:hypothetical protein